MLYSRVRTIVHYSTALHCSNTPRSFSIRSAMASSSTQATLPFDWDNTPKPTCPTTPIHKLTTSPLHTAGILIIGDEILSSKTRDTNSAFFARYCFEAGIDLTRIEVVPDDEPEIIESVRRISEKCDFVVTSGGIGPTHDDITYEAIGKAFGLRVERHKGTQERMRKLARGKDGNKVDWVGKNEEEKEAIRNRLRMAEFPVGDEKTPVNVIWPKDDLWVPIVAVKNIHILPGVPSLFQTLLEHLLPYLHLDPDNKQRRIQIRTPMPESEVSSFLRAMQDSLIASGSSIKIGSYPRWKKEWNTVTLLGRVGEDIDSVAETVREGVRGITISSEEEEEARDKAGLPKAEPVGTPGAPRGSMG